MTKFIIAQILSIIALILVCVSYFFKNKSQFLIFQTISNIFYASAFLVLDALVGGINSLISVLRCIYIYFAEQKNFKYIYHFIPIFLIGYVVNAIFCWNNWFDIIPILTSTIFTLSFLIKNLKTMKIVLLVPNVLLICYSILTKAYVNAIIDLIEVVVIIIAIFFKAKEPLQTELKQNNNCKNLKNEQNLH